MRQHIGSSLTNGIYYAVYRENEVIYMNAVVVKDITNQITLYTNCKKENLVVEIYFPILNQINILSAKTDSVQRVAMSENVLLFLGGELTYGVGTTAANSIFANIVSKKLGMQGVNLSIYGSNYLTADIARQSIRYNPNYTISECSCKRMTLEYIKKNLEK